MSKTLTKLKIYLIFAEKTKCQVNKRVQSTKCFYCF